MLERMQKKRSSVVAEVNTVASGPTKEDMCKAQEREFGCLKEEEESDKRTVLNDGGLL